MFRGGGGPCDMWRVAERNISPTLDPVAAEHLRLEVRQRGVQPIARELGVARSAVTAVLAGTARPGTTALVALAWRRRERSL